VPRNVLVLTMLLVLGASSTAAAQTPMPSTPPDAFPVADIPGDSEGVARGTGGGAVGTLRGRRTRPKLVKRCSTKRSTGTRICRYRRSGIVVKTCTRKRGRKHFKCRANRAAVTEALPNARFAALQRQGWQHPALPAVGRIYRNGRGHCTGTLITRGVVVTAGHCVFSASHEGGSNAYYDRNQLRFVPGNEYDGTSRYGVWAVAASYTTQAYAAGDNGADWGFLVLAPDSTGRYAGDYVPGTFATRALVSGITPQTVISRMGYPSEGGWNTSTYYNGNGQYFCVDNYNQARQDGFQHYWLEFGAPFCPMNGGSSGGPNFVQLSDGSWAIVAVNNRGARGAAPDLWGQTAYNSWFDQQFLSFYDTVFSMLSSRKAGIATAREVVAAG
jgi:hypothetical protein